MKKEAKARRKIPYQLMWIFILLAFFSVRASASGNNAMVYGEPDEAAISVDIPVMEDSERAVFDFILDPEGLLYDTEAMRYGGGRVEEGATLLFFNAEGEYDFSRRSDFLSIRNSSTIPFSVTVSAQLTGLGSLQLAETADFQDNECSVYFAIIDNRGRELPLSADGEVGLVWEIQPELGIDSYSFGLTGACNPNACWQGCAEKPVVTVTWRAEPVLTETEAPPQDDARAATEENVIGEKDGDDNPEETEMPEMEYNASSEEELDSTGSEAMMDVPEVATDEAMDEETDGMVKEST